MKKFFFIAAAVVAMAACTKTEVQFNETADSNKIGFEVANFSSQALTKASGAITSESIFSFSTVANQFPTIGDPVVFMNDVDILPWNGTTQVTDANFDSNSITAWAPAEDYYWPKTGWINFYSYAGSHTPTVGNNAADKKTVTFTYNNAVIVADSNILVADAALHYGRTNSQTQTYGVDKGETTSSHVTKGVPTLFRHQLAKIIVDVEARTQPDKKSANTVWKVQVLGTYDADHKSTIVPINKGSLLLTNVDASTTAETKTWVPTNESTTNISGWVPSTAAADKETISLSDSEVLTIDKNTTGNGNKSQILAARSVMPQLTANVGFTLVYKVQALHNDTVFMEEIRTVGIGTGEEKSIGNLANTVTSWGANQKITYHIIIDPVSEKVTFDPAVEEYVAVDADGDVINEINVNENGLVTP